MGDEVQRTDEEWRERLTPEEYRVTREKGTEPPFTGEYCHAMLPGTYHCVCCDLVLYSSQTKFDSGSGWPSYFQPVNENAIRIEQDGSLGMVREEILCARCGAHLGHRFNDGPPPTGHRHCINSTSLRLVADGDPHTPADR